MSFATKWRTYRSFILAGNHWYVAMIYPTRVGLMGFLATDNLILSSNAISCWSGPRRCHRLPSRGVQGLVDVLVRRVCLHGRAAPPRRRRAGRAPPCQGPRAQTLPHLSAAPAHDVDKRWRVGAMLGWLTDATRIWLNEVISDVLWERESRIWSRQSLSRCCCSCNRTTTAAARPERAAWAKSSSSISMAPMTVRPHPILSPA
jgi:hypothetical protein